MKNDKDGIIYVGALCMLILGLIIGYSLNVPTLDKIKASEDEYLVRGEIFNNTYEKAWYGQDFIGWQDIGFKCRHVKDEMFICRRFHDAYTDGINQTQE